jgi:alpha-mannosidase
MDDAVMDDPARGPAVREETGREEPRRTVAIVPHTHWDREWYSTFQTFRLRLVDLLDEFLPRLEADPSYAHFLLDGQMAVVDDYLAIRPDAEAALRRLAGSGRLSVGPWYILMDEFLVSGETIVRNLQLGLERAAALGGAMPVGYLPDMFGHIAQMPQLLCLAGFDHAVVWRGVPAAVDRSAFWWSAPDGSTVRAEYLRVGYGNGAAVPDDAKAFVRRVAAHEAELGSFLLEPASPILWMNGTDHQTPQPWLGRVVAEANGLQHDYRFVITSLPEYLTAAPAVGLPGWRGELRSGARANLLMGVASNRVDVKQAAARAERALEQQAEPLCALWMPAELWPKAQLDLAWLEVIRNSAHDSICACSADEVGTAVLHRYSEATAIADGLRRRAVKLAGAVLPVDGPIVINPSARARGGVIELTLPGEQWVVGGQLIEATPSASVEITGLGRELPMLLGTLIDQGLVSDGTLRSVEITPAESQLDVVLRTGRGHRRAWTVASAMAELWAQAGAHPGIPVHVRVERAASQRVAVHVPSVPGYGWAAWSPEPLGADPVEVHGDGMANGLADVVIDPLTGTFSLNGHGGLDRLVDDGDDGDTYNWNPAASDVVIDRPDAVKIDIVESGPVRGRIHLTRTYRWPSRVDHGKRVGQQRVEVHTWLELRAGEDLVRISATFENRARDHRLRAWFPLPSPATVSTAECAFAVVERGLRAEGGPHEPPLATYPSRRFVAAGGLTVLHEGLLEYELADGGRALALTLVRSTGMLSRNHMASRPNPAGPALPLEGPQLQERVSLHYAVHLGRRDPYALADEAWVPFEVAHGAGGSGTASERASSGSLLAVSGASVSSLRRAGGALELRVFNPTPAETSVVIDGRRGWLVDLRGAPLGPFEQSFPLRAWGIATARLADPQS